MKKLSMLMIVFLLITLSSCISITSDSLTINLNPGVDTVEVGQTFTDAGVTASYGYRILTPTITENTVDTTRVGTYHIVYEITYLDFVKTVIRMVTVIDHTPPVLSLIAGVDTIVIGSTWSDAGVNMSDNSSDSVDLTIIGEVNVNVAGEYTITYHAEDSSGNTAEIVRYVNVVDLANE